MVMDTSQFSVIWTNKKRDLEDDEVEKKSCFQEKLIEAVRSDSILRHMSARCRWRFHVTLWFLFSFFSCSNKQLTFLIATRDNENVSKKGNIKQTPITEWLCIRQSQLMWIKTTHDDGSGSGKATIIQFIKTQPQLRCPSIDLCETGDDLIDAVIASRLRNETEADNERVADRKPPVKNADSPSESHSHSLQLKTIAQQLPWLMSLNYASQLMASWYSVWRWKTSCWIALCHILASLLLFRFQLGVFIVSASVKHRGFVDIQNQ